MSDEMVYVIIHPKTGKVHACWYGGRISCCGMATSKELALEKRSIAEVECGRCRSLLLQDLERDKDEPMKAERMRQRYLVFLEGFKSGVATKDGALVTDPELKRIYERGRIEGEAAQTRAVAMARRNFGVKDG